MPIDCTSTLEFLNAYISSFVIFPLILLVGLYLCLYLGPIQFTQFRTAISNLMGKNRKGCKKHLSSFEALVTVLAGNLGTGNISGMAVALATGGPGSLPWMWVMAFFGAIIKYAGCVLGLKYRDKKSCGRYVGGPMFYLDQGLGWKPVAWVFSISALFCSLTVGNLVQVNSLALPLERAGIPPLGFGLIMAALVGAVIWGGLKRVTSVVTAVVPFMTFLYIGFAFYILFLFSHEIIPACKEIFAEAFNFQSLMGGALGFSMLKAIGVGFERGIFATDAGTGVAPILQSGIKTENRIIEGIIAMIAPMVVMCICSITFLVLMVTKAHLSSEESTNMCLWAFSHALFFPFSHHIVTVSLFFFAFTTIIAWFTCAEKVLYYLFSVQESRIFKYLFIALIPFGAIAQSHLVWHLADFFLGVMLISNVMGIIGLSTELIEDSKEFLDIDNASDSNS